MLKYRVIPILLIKDGLLKKPVQFKNPRTVASPITITKVFEQRQVDELILLNINNSNFDSEETKFLVKDIAEELSVPFAFGGSIRSLEHIKEIITAGAEKVVLNTYAIKNPDIITKAKNLFGSQCIIISIDVMETKSGYEVFSECGSKATGLCPIKWAKDVEKLGAGEILINSINHDGMMQGYNMKLIKKVAKAVSIPVIAAGGARNLDDFISAIKNCGASAVAAGSIFHYTKFTPNMIKGALIEAGIPVRVYHDIDYRFEY